MSSEAKEKPPTGLRSVATADFDSTAWLTETLDVLAAAARSLRLAKPAEIQSAAFAAVRASLLRLIDFEACCLVVPDDDLLGFHIADCEPESMRATLESELTRLVQGGEFGWALGESHPVVTHAGDGTRGVVLHVLPGRTRILGSFMGLTPSSETAIPDVDRKLISVLLLQCAAAIESAMLQSELAHSNRHLEARVAVRTAELQGLKDEAQAASEAKSSFLANMSHELRTPMNGVIGMADVLSATELTDSQRECLRLITSSADGVLTIVNDILDLTKIEAGQMSLESIHFDLHPIVADLVAMFSDQAASGGISLRSQISDSVPNRLRGDPLRLRQVLTNLISNAIKFTEQGSVTVRLDSKPAQDGRVRVLFEVSDTGIGMNEAARTGMFAPFHQADSSNTRRFGGTGLGLSISQSIVEMMGGRIQVESEEGVGSRFEFGVEFEVELEVELEVEVESAPVDDEFPLRGRRVLLVEDNLVNQKVAIHMLERSQASIDLAQNGAEAVTRFADGDYDLVLMDCQMPVMDGFSATRAIRAAEAEHGGHVLIIAMTANAIDGDRERCIESGMDDYLTKPVKYDVLLETLRTWIRKLDPLD